MAVKKQLYFLHILKELRAQVPLSGTGQKQQETKQNHSCTLSPGSTFLVALQNNLYGQELS